MSFLHNNLGQSSIEPFLSFYSIRLMDVYYSSNALPQRLLSPMYVAVVVVVVGLCLMVRVVLACAVSVAPKADLILLSF
jgi:hypothetical protein